MTQDLKPLYAGRRQEEDKAISIPLGFITDSYQNTLSIAAIIHIYYDEIAYEILSYAQNFTYGTDIFISTDTEMKAERLRKVFSSYKFGKVEVQLFPNRGRDIAPKIVGFRDVYSRYDYILHLHSKRTLHNTRVDSWRAYLYESLCGSPEVVRDILGIFVSQPRIGMIFPQHYEYIRQWISWGENLEKAQELAARIGFSLPADQTVDFPSGSMFWVRSAALKPLLDIDLTFEDFPTEAGQQDNTMAHAIERLYAIICEKSGYDWIKVASPDLMTDASQVFSVIEPQDLSLFISKNTVRLTGGTSVPKSDYKSSTDVEVTSTLAKITKRNSLLIKYGNIFSGWSKIPFL